MKQIYFLVLAMGLLISVHAQQRDSTILAQAETGIDSVRVHFDTVVTWCLVIDTSMETERHYVDGVQVLPQPPPNSWPKFKTLAILSQNYYAVGGTPALEVLQSVTTYSTKNGTSISIMYQKHYGFLTLAKTQWPQGFLLFGTGQKPY